MVSQNELYPGRRLSFDGALCTVRAVLNEVKGAKGEWIGVEWDDPSRGKHNGTHNGQRYFDVRSRETTTASFVRPTRKRDAERTVLEAIRYKYALPDSMDQRETVIISGKVAEEIGFDKISREQSSLAELRIVLLDGHLVNGLAPRSSSLDQVKKAQIELTETCPSIVELDLSYNTFETWADIEDVCSVLPRLRVLKLNGLRFRDFNSAIRSRNAHVWNSLHELHLNECLLRPSELMSILGDSVKATFPNLSTLSISHNELENFQILRKNVVNCPNVHTVLLENNLFTNLESVGQILTVFPKARHVSFQGCQISEIGSLTSPFEATEHLSNLNLAQNTIQDFAFVDRIQVVFPNLHALRISKNPVYDNPYPATPNASPAETNYYLTLARVPTLESLNFTKITPREREEGEIYYLAVCEKELRMRISELDLTTMSAPARERESKVLEIQFPQYARLCTKHDRDNLLQSMLSAQSDTTVFELTTKPSHPPGSLASRVVTTTFYIPKSHPDTAFPHLSSFRSVTPATSSAPSATTATDTSIGSDATSKIAAGASAPVAPRERSFSRLLTTTHPASQIFALVSRTLDLLPMQFRLVYESPELDPAMDDRSTRSQLYTSSGQKRADRNDNISIEAKWDEWGDWDVDTVVDADLRRGIDTKHIAGGSTTPSTIANVVEEVTTADRGDDGVDGYGAGLVTQEGIWKEGGILLKDGRKWRRREVEIVMGLRDWGDFLEKGVQEARVRVEPFAKLYN